MKLFIRQERRGTLQRPWHSPDHDIDYFYASRLPGKAADGTEDMHFHPLEPRAIRLFLAYKF